MDKELENLISNNQTTDYQNSLNILNNYLTEELSIFREKIISYLQKNLHFIEEKDILNKKFVQAYVNEVTKIYQDYLHQWFKYITNLEHELSSSLKTPDDLLFLKTKIKQRSIVKPESIYTLARKYYDSWVNMFQRNNILNRDKHLLNIEEITFEPIENLNRKFKALVINLANDLNTSLDSLQFKKEIPSIDFPENLLPNLIRILSFTGFKLQKENNNFYAFDEKRNIKEKIIFGEDYIFFYLENNPHKQYGLDTLIKAENKEVIPHIDCYVDEKISIRYSKAQEKLTLANNKEGIAYIICHDEEGKIICKKMQEGKEIPDSESNILREIGSTFPYALNAFMKELSSKRKEQRSIFEEKEKLQEELKEIDEEIEKLTILKEEKEKRLAELSALTEPNNEELNHHSMK